MTGALLSPSSPFYDKDVCVEQYYLVSKHGRTDLDRAFGLVTQEVKFLDKGPVIDTVEGIAEALQTNFNKKSKREDVFYTFLVFVNFLSFTSLHFNIYVYIC
jgi:hypothetical protein